MAAVMNTWEMIGYVRVNLFDRHHDGEDFERVCRRTFILMNPAQREALAQLVNHGPVWDGDVTSKTARDDLLTAKLASRACVKGEQGYTVANYVGWSVLKYGTEAREKLA